MIQSSRLSSSMDSKTEILNESEKIKKQENDKKNVPFINIKMIDVADWGYNNNSPLVIISAITPIMILYMFIINHYKNNPSFIDSERDNIKSKL